jgi:hypothetical protein
MVVNRHALLSSRQSGESGWHFTRARKPGAGADHFLHDPAKEPATFRGRNIE